MGFLKYFTAQTVSELVPLPSGSFSVDSEGGIIVSTLPQAFPPALLRELGHLAIEMFRGARDAQMPITEFSVTYPALRLTARELRGGAIVFFFPLSLAST
jgi:hypothetical protein